MSFFKMATGTLGVIFASALAITAGVRGCSEAVKDNAPGETNTEQFFKGAGDAAKDSVEGTAKSLTDFDSKDVTRVLEKTEEFGKKIYDGVADYVGEKTKDLGHDRSSSWLWGEEPQVKPLPPCYKTNEEIPKLICPDEPEP